MRIDWINSFTSFYSNCKKKIIYSIPNKCDIVLGSYSKLSDQNFEINLMLEGKIKL